MSHPMWVRGLKLSWTFPYFGNDHVAPYVGAWIETKLVAMAEREEQVAPYVGAWIETCSRIPVVDRIPSRTLCGCVD